MSFLRLVFTAALDSGDDRIYLFFCAHSQPTTLPAKPTTFLHPSSPISPIHASKLWIVSRLLQRVSHTCLAIQMACWKKAPEKGKQVIQGKILFWGLFLPFFNPGPVAGPRRFPISSRRPETYFLAVQFENCSDPHPPYLQKICPQNMPCNGGLHGI